MPKQLLPFPAFHHLPFGAEYEDLPVTRDGVRAVPAGTFTKTAYSSYAQLTVRNRDTGRFSRGICGLLPWSSFMDGTIRPHEQTLHSRLKRQEELVRADGGALGKPVLLTVPSLKDWWAAADQTQTADASGLEFAGRQNHYELRAYGREVKPGGTYQLPPPLPEAGPLCIADGHHRAETHALLGEAGVPGFEFVPVCIIGADELTIGAFARLIDNGQTLESLLPTLLPFFDVEPLDAPLAPTQNGEWLLTRNDLNYRLRRKDFDFASPIDVEWLEHTVLPAVFGITDTRSDERIAFEPVDTTPDGRLKLSNLPGQTCLTGFPLPTSTFFDEIAAGRLLPPKSTRFEPRVPSGLVVWVPE